MIQESSSSAASEKPAYKPKKQAVLTSLGVSVKDPKASANKDTVKRVRQKVTLASLGVKVRKNYLDKSKLQELIAECEAISYTRFVHPRWKQNLPFEQTLVHFGDKEETYTYTGIKIKSVPAPATVAETAQKIGAEAGRKFRIAFINKYGENDCINPHQDLREVASQTSIHSISLGGTRVFKVTTLDGTKVAEEPVEENDYIVMSHEMNSTCLHSVPRPTKTWAKKIGEKINQNRYNITFRE